MHQGECAGEAKRSGGYGIDVPCTRRNLWLWLLGRRAVVPWNSLPPAPILGPDRARVRRDVDLLLAASVLRHLCSHLLCGSLKNQEARAVD